MEPTDQDFKACYFKARGLVSEAMRAKAERGILPSCAPLGYKNVVVEGVRVIVIDPEIAPKVKRLFELVARKKMSFRKLAVEAENMGLRSRNEKTFGRSALKAVLSNPFYSGKITYQNELILGHHEGLIAIEDFDRAQDHITEKA